MKKERESMEWTNTWWSEANADGKRGLLIGDSVTRQLRGSIEVLLKDLYAVDLYASSFSIHDKMLEDYIDMMFKYEDYEYDFIILNYGGHHGFSRLCSESTKEYTKYQERYTELLKYLLEKCEKVVCVTGTSEVLDTDCHVIDQKTECEIVSRNQIVLDVARVNHAAIFDLYDLMKKNRKIYTYSDRQHFNRDSDYFISCNLLWDMLTKKMVDSDRINKKRAQDRERLMGLTGYNKKYMIYGAGARGISLYWILKWYGMEDIISCFVVSHGINEARILQKRVVVISELGTDECENGVLIISSDRYRNEMYQMASELHIQNLVYYEDFIYCLLGC